MKVAFRADASADIGAGHVMRCLALADEIARRSGNIAFLTLASAGPLISAVRARGYLAYVLDAANQRFAGSQSGGASGADACWQEDAERSIAALADFGRPDWLMVDHYALDARWEAGLRPAASRILAIDDLADRPHDCDLLLDQNYAHAMETRYDSLVPRACVRLLGPRYALLRQEFAERRARLRKHDGSVRRILLTFGGADTSGETSKALRALIELDLRHMEIVTVAGALNPRMTEIRALCARLPRAVLHAHADNMADLMADADLAIGAGGSTTWERCCLGLPTITIATADNQEPAMARMSAELAVLHLGRAASVSVQDIATAVRKALDSPDLLVRLAQKALTVADGHGADRVCESMGLPRSDARAQIGALHTQSTSEAPPSEAGK